MYVLSLYAFPFMFEHVSSYYLQTSISILRWIHVKDLTLVVYLTEQDEGLEALSGVLSQQRRIASAIGTEVEQQNGEQTVNVCT